jgi:hypothetical protein
MATACITQVAFGFEPKDKPVVALRAKSSCPGLAWSRSRRESSSRPYLDIPPALPGTPPRGTCSITIERGTRLTLGGSPTGRFCPVHNWPVFTCPPRDKQVEGSLREHSVSFSASCWPRCSASWSS